MSSELDLDAVLEFAIQLARDVRLSLSFTAEGGY